MPNLDDPLPQTLQTHARWERLGAARTPAMIVHPDWDSGHRVPVLFWIHGRTACKEIDPGRFLRLIRAGMGACSIDLPGHGERFAEEMQHPSRTLEIIQAVTAEIDDIVEATMAFGVFDDQRMALGGMSAGGMATIARLCRPHPFCCATLEAATGSWRHQVNRPMFEGISREAITDIDPIRTLDRWREIPLQAIHCRRDRWVDWYGQAAFLDALRSHYRQPELVEHVLYEQTGAAWEHAGFNRMGSDAKNRQLDFLRRVLQSST